ncbi:hypothetical protein HOY80DRAFT_1006834 [Tuber brumale]|nr:hypothetical protein HOY80DRAFT_1006834 [Tuber brumale]
MLLLPTRRVIRSISLGLEPEKYRPAAGHAGSLCFHPDRKLGMHDMVQYSTKGHGISVYWSTSTVHDGKIKCAFRTAACGSSQLPYPSLFFPAVNSWYFLSGSQFDRSRVANGM